MMLKVFNEDVEIIVLEQVLKKFMIHDSLNYLINMGEIHNYSFFCGIKVFVD